MPLVMRDVFRALTARRNTLKETMAIGLEGRSAVRRAFVDSLRLSTKTTKKVLSWPLSSRNAQLLIDQEISRRGGAKAANAHDIEQIVSNLNTQAHPVLNWADMMRRRVEALPSNERDGAMAHVTKLMKKGQALAEGFMDRLEIALSLPQSTKIRRLQYALGQQVRGRFQAQFALEGEARRIMEATGKQGGPAYDSQILRFRAKELQREALAIGALKEVREETWVDTLAASRVYVRKQAMVYQAEKLEAPRVIQTLEGPSDAQAGDWLLTGVAGERWPVDGDKFHSLYEAVPGDPGKFTSKPRLLPTKMVDRAVTIENRYGKQSGHPGSFVMTEGAGSDGKPNSWIVQREIMNKSWEWGMA